MQQDIFEYGYFYHIFHKGNNDENIFIEERNYAFFLQLLKKHVLPMADIYAYCLLKNHFHILVKIKDETNIFDAKLRKKVYLGFSHMLNSYTQSINKVYKRKGSLFCEHLKRIKVTDEQYLKELIVYIHLNPVKHGFSTSVNYPHSSYNSIISKQKTEIKRDEVLSYFDDVENFIYWHDFKKIQRIMMNNDE
jgi:REP element-mobilizing transposase RayT